MAQGRYFTHSHGLEKSSSKLLAGINKQPVPKKARALIVSVL